MNEKINNLPFFLENGSVGTNQLSDLFGHLNNVISQYWLKLNKPYSGISVEEQSKLLSEQLPIESELLTNVLDEIGEKIIQNSLNVANPLSIAHFHCNPSFSSVASEILIALTNQSLDSWDEAPSATFVELLVLKWFIELVGWDSSSSGTFDSGGTMANQMAVLLSRNLAAKKHFEIDLTHSSMATNSELSKLRIFGSEEIHFSIDKAASMCGIGKDAIIKIKANNFSIDTNELEKELEKQQKEGNIPCLIIGMAGTTNQGAFDNLIELSRLAKKYDAWFHVDAAYGGALLCSSQYNYLLRGIELADSITLDPHKLFYQSISCGVFLLKNSKHFDLIKEYADYLNPIEHEEAGIPNLVTNSLQTSRRFDALKMYAAFKHFGVKGFGNNVKQTFLVAKYLEQLVSNNSNFELLHKPQSNVVSFRYKPSKKVVDLNVLNKEIQSSLLFSGKAVIASYTNNGCTWLKTSIMNPFTTKDDIDRLIEYICNYGELICEKDKYEKR